MLSSLLILALAALAGGCGSTPKSQPTASPIIVTTATGAAVTTNTVALGASVTLGMTPAGDIAGTGVDWNITCQGNPITGSLTNGACGTLAAAHTASGKTTVYTAPSLAPINNTVTVTATVTGNPAQTSAVTFIVVSLPIGVGLTQTPPASMAVSTSAFLVATVNDPAEAGLIWTAVCNSGACGSFNPTVTSSGLVTKYTAPAIVPAGGTITIKATSLSDTTKSASATLTVTPPLPPVPVTINVVPAVTYVTTGGSTHSTPLEAIVGNDPTLAGADWSLSCSVSNCGTITAHTASGIANTYTAPSSGIPSGGTVTITATSTTNPAVFATSVVNVVSAAPITVKLASTPPATLIAGSQTTLSATSTGDADNLGINWTATCGSAGACGTFGVSPPSSTPGHSANGGTITYTGPSAVPAGGLVTITASSASTSPANPAIAFTSILVPPPALSFAAQPPPRMTSLTQAPVSATVANDVAPGGVNWSVQCGSTVPGGCGWVLPAHTASGATAVYTAPPVTSNGTTAIITATSAASSSVTLNSSAIAITPSTTLAVAFVPSLPAQMEPNGTVNVIASVANDTTNAGIDWQVCAGTCGFFTVKPAIPAIPATPTTPYVPAVPAVTATSVSGWPNGLPIPYTAPSQAPASGNVGVAAFAHANRSAAISGTINVTTSSTGPALHGLVLAGSQPVAGASVALYAAGTSGYGSAASQVAVSSAAKDGSFTIPATYVCPASSSQMYLVATGGSVGSSSANPNLALMTALGSCANLPSATVVVNEVTTIASAYATAPFAADDAFTGNSSYLYLGTSSGNLTGLANAFASVNNLADISTGKVRYFTPAANAAVPFAEIDTLADVLNACTASSGGVQGDGSACSTLFTATTVFNLLPGAIPPSDTLQAAFNIAQHPVTNRGYTLDTGVVKLASSSSPFQPILSTTQPNDLSISLNYTGGGGLSSTSVVGSFAIDASGNIWITDTAAGSVVEWNSTAAALSPATGFTAGGGPIAIDAAGNVWISGNGVLTELTSLGTPVLGSPYVGVAGGGSDAAFDAQSNLWIANAGGVNEFNNFGAELSPASGFTNTGITGITAVGIDSSSNVWVGNAVPNGASGTFSELTNPGGQLIVESQGASRPFYPELAADSAGDVWGLDISGASICEVPPYKGKGQVLVNACLAGSFTTGTTTNNAAFYTARGLAFDGAGVVWIASGSAGPSILPLAGLNDYNAKFLSSPSLAAGPLRVAVDGSGNVWVLLANNTVTEYVGVATPVVTPLALGVKNKKLAAKP